MNKIRESIILLTCHSLDDLSHSISQSSCLQISRHTLLNSINAIKLANLLDRLESSEMKQGPYSEYCLIKLSHYTYLFCYHFDTQDLDPKLEVQTNRRMSYPKAQMSD